MAKLSNEEIALVMLVAAESVHAFSAFNPSIFTIRHFHKQDGEDTSSDIHAGNALAFIFALFIGVFTAILTGTWLPIYGAVAASILMVSVYEWALRTSRTESVGEFG